MIVVLTIAGLDPEHGGPSRSVPALAEALAQGGARVKLITCEPAANQGTPRLPDAPLVTSRMLPFANRSTRWAARRNGFFSALQKHYHEETDSVIHDNGLWLPNNHAVATAARVLSRPLLISPRGMLSEWARTHKSWKKKMAWWLYQRRDLQSARVLHATSGTEADAFRAAGLIQPIAVIPNGVELPAYQRPDVRGRKSAERTLLFLSRIHPVKGLLDLVRAWARVKAEASREQKAPWRMVIAGGSEGGHLNEVKAEIKKLGAAGSKSQGAGCFENGIQFVGAVEGEAKWELYRSADLFVLPSHSENFGTAIAEALACGVPIITTKGTPWKDVVAHRCGWWTEIGAEPLAAALREAMGQTEAERHEMGRRGRAWMERDFGWAEVAQKMMAVYAWMLDQEPRPACII